MTSLVVLLVPLCVLSSVYVKGASEGLDFGKGTHVLGKFFIHYLNTQPEDIKLSEGVHLVSIKSDHNGRSLNKDKTVLGAIENYLQSHEIRIKLPELMPGEEFGRSFKEAIEDIDESNEVVTGRRRGGNGGGGGGGGGMSSGMMVMGVMMGKLLTTLGLGGVALIAKKALFVSVLALTLSAIIGIKKLVHSDDHHEGHTVIHAAHHGHGHDLHEYRRKRDVNQVAYRAWKGFN